MESEGRCDLVVARRVIVAPTWADRFWTMLQVTPIDWAGQRLLKGRELAMMREAAIYQVELDTQ